MSGTQNTSPGKPDPLRLDRCPDCGYLLEGLPEQGICPECGFVYRPDMLVLYGWAAGLNLNAVTTRGWKTFWCLVIFHAYLAFSTGRWLLQGNLRYGLLGVGLFVASIALTVHRRRETRRESPAPVQLRLLPEGIAERAGFGTVKIVPWDRVSTMQIHWLGGQTYEVHADRRATSSWNMLREGATAAQFQIDINSAHMARLTARLRQWYPKLILKDARNSNRVRQVTDFSIAGNPPPLTTAN